MTIPYSSHVRAVYEKGHLRLLKPIDLPEGAKVRITIHTEENKDSTSVSPFLSANHLEAILNLVSVGGDALADSEAVYDEDWS